MPDFPYLESEAAELSGLPLKKFAAARVRHLKQGIHWDLDGSQVAYCPEGLLAVIEQITGKNTGGELVLKFAQKTTAPAEKLSAKVTRIYPNPHLLEARLEDTGELIRVRCRTTKNFRIGMELPVQTSGMAGIYDLARRLPRYGGRW